jgi:hypothetical protein
LARHKSQSATAALDPSGSLPEGYFRPNATSTAAIRNDSSTYAPCKGGAFSRRAFVWRRYSRLVIAHRILVIGGATLGGPRYIWWNFVASSRERIESAKEQWRKADWGRGLFDLPADDRDEFTPLPPTRPVADH